MPLKSAGASKSPGTAKSTVTAKCAGASKSAVTEKSTGTAQVAFTATTSTRSALAAIPGSTGTKKKGSKSAALVERKAGRGKQIVCSLYKESPRARPLPLSFPFTISVRTPG